MRLCVCIYTTSVSECVSVSVSEFECVCLFESMYVFFSMCLHICTYVQFIRYLPMPQCPE